MKEPIIVKQKLGGNILYCTMSLIMSLASLVGIFANLKGTRGIVGLITQNSVTYIILKLVLTIGFVFFAYGFLFFIKRAKQGKSILVVDEKGITDNSSAISFGFIPWEDIDRVYVDGVLGNHFIELCLNNEEKYTNRLSGLKKQAVLTNKKMGHQVVCITLNSTGISPHPLFPAIEERFLEAKSKQQ